MTNSKSDKSFAIILGISILVGIFYTVFFIPGFLQDPQSAWSRFSQNFFSYWTLLPFGIISFGSFIIASTINKRYDYTNGIFYKLISCGILAILIGFMFFWLYIID